MEPMALGSPPSSPASPSVHPNFLPSFLMGDAQPSSPNPNNSPGRNKPSNIKVGFSTPNDPRNLRQKLFNQSLNETSFGQSPYNTIHADKSGPPKQGLFDTIESKLSPPVLSSTQQGYGEHQTFTPNDSLSRICGDSVNYGNAVTNLNESLNRTQQFTNVSVARKVDTLWITVFGFPPSATSLILAQLANCGCIVDKKFPTQGNWINLKFSTFQEVSQALCLNGKLISSNIMIGVVPHVNKQENKENFNNSGVTSPLRARSLRHSFVSPQNANTVVPQNVPQKSTGLVTKAMEYVFGW